MDAPNNVEITLDYMLSLKIFIESEYSNSIVIIIKKIYTFLKELNKTDLEIKNAINLLYNSIDPAQIDNVNYIFDRITTTNNEIISTNNGIQFENIIDPYTSDFTNPVLFLNMFETNINNLINNANNNIINNNNLLYNIINSAGYNITNAGNNTGNDPNDAGTDTGNDAGTDTGNDADIDSDDTEENTNDDVLPTLVPVHHTLFGPQLFYFINNAINNMEPPIEQINSNVTTLDFLNKNTITTKYTELDNKIKEKYKSCSLCLDDYNNDAIVRKLKCEHIFHPHCIDPWVLNEDYKCPICRDDSLMPRLSPELDN